MCRKTSPSMPPDAKQRRSGCIAPLWSSFTCGTKGRNASGATEMSTVANTADTAGEGDGAMIWRGRDGFLHLMNSV